VSLDGSIQRVVPVKPVCRSCRSGTPRRAAGVCRVDVPAETAFGDACSGLAVGVKMVPPAAPSTVAPGASSPAASTALAGTAQCCKAAYPAAPAQTSKHLPQLRRRLPVRPRRHPPRVGSCTVPRSRWSKSGFVSAVPSLSCCVGATCSINSSDHVPGGHRFAMGPYSSNSTALPEVFDRSQTSANGR